MYEIKILLVTGDVWNGIPVAAVDLTAVIRPAENCSSPIEFLDDRMQVGVQHMFPLYKHIFVKYQGPIGDY